LYRHLYTHPEQSVLLDLIKHESCSFLPYLDSQFHGAVLQSVGRSAPRDKSTRTTATSCQFLVTARAVGPKMAAATFAAVKYGGKKREGRAKLRLMGVAGREREREREKERERERERE
jgi:hypothetical protein